MNLLLKTKELALSMTIFLGVVAKPHPNWEKVYLVNGANISM